MIQTKITYTRRPIKLRALSLSAIQMAALGTEGLASIRERVTKGIGSDDEPMPPLSNHAFLVSGTHGSLVRKGPPYAEWKSRHGLNPIRDLVGPGADAHMLDNLSVRFADNHSVKIALTSRSARIKAWANEKRASWLLWSDSDQKRIISLATKLWNGEVKKLEQETAEAIG